MAIPQPAFCVHLVQSVSRVGAGGGWRGLLAGVSHLQAGAVDAWRTSSLTPHSSRRLDTSAVWSIARGLARRVDDYKGHLAACDLPHRNDLGGRGPLSEETSEEARVSHSRISLRVLYRSQQARNMCLAR